MGTEEPQPVIQNIDMFMACCDWEAAIQAEKAERESGQKIVNDPLETQPMQNNVNDDITNNLNKSCKRKLKMDLKSKNSNVDAISKVKNDLLLANED